MQVNACWAVQLLGIACIQKFGDKRQGTLYSICSIYSFNKECPIIYTLLYFIEIGKNGNYQNELGCGVL